MVKIADEYEMRTEDAEFIEDSGIIEGLIQGGVTEVDTSGCLRRE